MAFVFNFPDVGEGIHEGRVVEWLVAEGDAVAEDQAMLKVETDKAVVELPSPHTGTVLKLHVAADATIFVGDALVTIGSPDEELPEVEAAPAEAPKGSAPAPAGVEAGSSVAPAVAAKRPLATPRTRALARKLGVELSQIVGSGSGGRILDEDVQRAADGGGGLPATVPVVASGVVAATADGEVERVPISHLRKMIANAMRASKQNAAHVTHVDEADVTDLVAHYRRAKPVIEERTGVRFTLLPFFIKALVATLQKYPIFNASVDEEQQEILFKKYYNIGVAVDTPEGLIVPVIRDADRKDMVELAAEVADKAERARSRQLALDEIRGGSCTLTNIGPLGGVFATPIINQPELAIVGLHAIKERPEVVNGEIAIRKMMYLSISFDHRYIDGAEAARFMSDMVRLVSEPMVLMARL
ncbi:MAG: 2-oxo acid dehydrogenase subunit E2 [Acidobacteriota bacterium]|jgi:pyruvate dehydrogenase E2 component (dihydrolipoamide acetyltransferase)|nr:2-oxo acid dehydrogenase subunit E2 [Acidobacteriota bacterium]